MSKQAIIVRLAFCFAVAMLSLDPVRADEARSSKPISQNNQSSSSSRWGDRLQQMQRSSSSSSSSRSSSSSGSSYRDSSRSSSNSSSYNRSSSNSSNYNRSSSSNTTSRPTTVTPGRGRSTTSSSSIDRDRLSRQSSYTQNRDSSSSSRNYTPSRSSSSSSQRTSTGSSSYSRDSRSRTYPGSLNRDRRTTPTGTVRVPVYGSSNPVDPTRFYNDRNSNQGSVRRGSYSGKDALTQDPSGKDSSDRDYREGRGDDSNHSSGDRHRDRDSQDHRDWGSHDRDGRDNHDRDGRNDKDHNNRQSWDRGSSSSHYTNSHSWNRDRNYGSSSYTRYRYDRKYDNDFRRYSYDWRRNYYCPYGSRFSSYRYFNRPYYSHSTFSTIIFASALGYGGYSSYNDGSYYENFGEAYVEFYENAGFRGEVLQVFAGEAILNLRDIRFDGYKSFNDRISSMRVFGDVTVVLYTDSDLSGEYVYMNGSHIDFSRDPVLRQFQDRVSSIEVLPGIVSPSTHQSNVRQYESNQFLSDVYVEPETEVTPSTSAHSLAATPPPPPANLAPIDTSRSPRVFLYDRPNFQGNQMVLNPGFVEGNLTTIPKGLAGTWDNTVASIRIEGGAELMLYTDPDFYGEAVTLDRNVSNLSTDSELIPFVNAVSSVIVNPPQQ